MTDPTALARSLLALHAEAEQSECDWEDFEEQARKDSPAIAAALLEAVEENEALRALLMRLLDFGYLGVQPSPCGVLPDEVIAALERA